MAGSCHLTQTLKLNILNGVINHKALGCLGVGDEVQGWGAAFEAMRLTIASSVLIIKFASHQYAFGSA